MVSELASIGIERQKLISCSVFDYLLYNNIHFARSRAIIRAHTHNAVTCNYPLTQSLHDSVVVVSGSQDSPPIEGQFITYTCPTGFILSGPNVSVCMGNREWEPDPGEEDCIRNS